MLIHKNALAACCEVAVKAAGKPDLAGVHVRANGMVEATDGAVLVQVKDGARSHEEYPAIDGLDVGAPGPVMVPTGTVQQALRFVPKKTFIPILQCVAIIPNGESVTLAVHNIEGVQRVDVKLGAPKFPAVDQVVSKQKKPVVTVKLSLEVLDTMVRALTAAKAKTVTLGIVDATTPIQLTASSEGEVTVTGLLAPMELVV